MRVAEDSWLADKSLALREFEDEDQAHARR